MHNSSHFTWFLTRIFPKNNIYIVHTVYIHPSIFMIFSQCFVIKYREKKVGKTPLNLDVSLMENFLRDASQLFSCSSPLDVEGMISLCASEQCGTAASFDVAMQDTVIGRTGKVSSDTDVKCPAGGHHRFHGPVSVRTHR